MPPTHPSFQSLVVASLVAASFDLCTVPHADTLLPYSEAGASFNAAASFDLGPMTDAKASFHNLVGASLVVASFPLCPMPHTDTSSDDLVGTSIK